jgi:hypothetical protein
MELNPWLLKGQVIRLRKDLTIFQWKEWYCLYLSLLLQKELGLWSTLADKKTMEPNPRLLKGQVIRLRKDLTLFQWKEWHCWYLSLLLQKELGLWSTLADKKTMMEPVPSTLTSRKKMKHLFGL